MRIVKSLSDVQTVLNQLLDWQTQIQTKNQDFHQLKITNAADGTDPRDYVTLEQLTQSTTTTNDITKVIQANQQDEFYTIVFSKDGTVVTGEASPAFIVGNGRAGSPTQAWVSCEEAPTSDVLSINFQITSYAVDNTPTLTTLLVNPLIIPIGSTLRVFGTLFNSVNFGIGTKITKVIVTGGNAAEVSMGVVVKLL